VGQFGNPDDLGVGLRVLGRVQDEIEDLVLRHALDDGCSFAPNHGTTLSRCRNRPDSGRTRRGTLDSRGPRVKRPLIITLVIAITALFSVGTALAVSTGTYDPAKQGC